MKKLTILLMVSVFALVSCDKADDVSSEDLILKKKPANHNNPNGGGGNTTYFILPDQENLTISVGETYQLATSPNLPTSWYTNDQQICQAYWDGHIQGVAPGITVISAFHYKEHGQPDQDYIIVTVVY